MQGFFKCKLLVASIAGFVIYLLSTFLSPPPGIYQSVAPHGEMDYSAGHLLGQKITAAATESAA